MTNTQVYYTDEKGKKVYLPNDVEIHFEKGNGGEFKVSTQGDSYRSLIVQDTRNKMTISPKDSKTIEIS